MVYLSFYGIESIHIGKKSDFGIVFSYFHFLSRAFATMAKSYTSQSYMNGKRDCNTFMPWSNMQIILF